MDIIKLSAAREILEQAGYIVSRIEPYDNMALPFDYSDNREFGVSRCNTVIVESLYFQSMEKFQKQIRLAVKDFDNYVVAVDEPRIILKNSFLGLFTSRKELETLLDKYCYRVQRYDYKGMYLVICPEYNIQNKNEKYYIHVSPEDHLDDIGIEPKASGKFETYSPRIYMYKLSELVDYDNSMENLGRELYFSCKQIVDRFNTVYSENKVYYVYLITIDDNRDIYIDNNYKSKNACYTFDRILPRYVKKITKII